MAQIPPFKLALHDKFTVGEKKFQIIGMLFKSGTLTHYEVEPDKYVSVKQMDQHYKRGIVKV